jgi:hypothetical protein
LHRRIGEIRMKVQYKTKQLFNLEKKSRKTGSKLQIKEEEKESLL